MKRILLTCAALFSAMWLCGSTIYLDVRSTGGANNGTSWTDAFTHPDSCDPNASAGDTVKMRASWDGAGDFFEIPAAAGTAGNYIYWIGCDSTSGEDNGERFLINADAYGFVPRTSYHVIKNIEVANASNTAFYVDDGENVLYNCYANSANVAFNNRFKSRNYYIQCSAVNPSGNAFVDAGIANSYYFCSVIGGGGHAYEFDNIGLIYGCLAHNCTGDAVYLNVNTLNPTWIIGNTFDGNANGIHDQNNQKNNTVMLLNRITNSDNYGIKLDNAASTGFENWNFFSGNDSGVILDDGDLIRGGGSLTSGTVGYYDLANDTFNLVDSASLRRVAIPVGIDSSNLYYGTAGLPPADTACAGGGGIYNPIIIRHGF